MFLKSIPLVTIYTYLHSYDKHNYHNFILSYDSNSNNAKTCNNNKVKRKIWTNTFILVSLPRLIAVEKEKRDEDPSSQLISVLNITRVPFCFVLRPPISVLVFVLTCPHSWVSQRYLVNKLEDGESIGLTRERRNISDCCSSIPQPLSTANHFISGKFNIMYGVLATVYFNGLSKVTRIGMKFRKNVLFL